MTRVADLSQLLAASRARGPGCCRPSTTTCTTPPRTATERSCGLTSSGTVAADIGRFVPGQQPTAHIAQFITVRDGRISAIATYDCYAPF